MMRNPLHCFLRFRGVSDRRTLYKNKTRLSLPEELCCYFSLVEIKAATKNFDPNLIIGRGGSAVVYKGFFHDHSYGTLEQVAVKLVKSWEDEQFRNEVRLLCQLRHQHLVPLIGFCHENNELVLVYKYMSKGTLYDCLHGSRTGRDPLPWKKRLEICIGVARGLHYLHTGAKRAVIHRDIKTKNILLDDQWIPKLADFGLSKIGPYSMSNAPLRIELPSMSEEQITTTMAGTIGYLDPEFYVDTTLVTDKSDVYSFGVVLLEVLCGRKVFKFDAEEDERHIVSWVRKCIRNGAIYQSIDPYLKGKIAPDCLVRFLEIALSCVKPKGNDRPALGEVETTLELALELQNKADSERGRIDPHGHGEGMYEEILFTGPAFDFSDYVKDTL
ncbi:hypothetical protein PTKIN_Ptkin15bG0181300 [Pterospermum kingtungense]